MANWASLENGSDAFIASYLSKTTTPAFRRNNPGTTELGFSPSPTKYATAIDMDDVFCTQENQDQCIAYLNQELTVIGYPSLYNTNTCAFDVTRLVNACHDLLKKQQKHAQLREDLESLQHKTATDLSQQQQNNVRIKTSFEQCQRDLVQSQEYERQIKEKHKLTETKLKAEKDEIKRLQLILKRKETQHHHEIKKKERELHRLKEKISDLLKNRKDRKIGMDVLNHVPTSNGMRPTWASPMIKDRKEVESLRMIITGFESREKELMSENSDLRDSLRHIQGKMGQLFSEPNSPVHSLPSPGHQATSPESIADETDIDEGLSVATNFSDDLSEGHFQLPFDTIKPNIDKNFSEMFKSLQNQAKKEAKENSDGSPTTPAKSKDEIQQDKEITKLNKMVTRLREIIEQQEKVIMEFMDQQNAWPGSATDLSILTDSQLEKEQENLHTEKEMFLQQKANFEEERKLYTEAVIRLGKEKKQFEEEKAAMLTKQFLQLSPFSSPNSSRNEGEKRLTNSTPIFSPAPRRLATPSTAELYRKLSLTDQLHANSSKPHRRSLETANKRSSQHSSKPATSRHVTPPQITMTSPPNARIMEHLEGIKTVLFNKNKTPDHDNH